MIEMIGRILGKIIPILESYFSIICSGALRCCEMIDPGISGRAVM